MQRAPRTGPQPVVPEQLFHPAGVPGFQLATQGDRQAIQRRDAGGVFLKRAAVLGDCLFGVAGG